jgi:hypothetical protein
MREDNGLFGYTVPSYAAMSASDLYVYRSCYCESCHQLRKNFGIVSTAAVNYDMTFSSIILNALSKDGVKDLNRRRGSICVLRKCTADTELLKKMAGYTILLTKWELEDDRRDGPGLRSNIAHIALGRAIRKAEKMYPDYDGHVRRGFETLTEMEGGGCTDPVRIGGTFASSLIPAIEDISGDAWTADLEKLFIGLGTIVYIMDAVDDLDDDYMNDSFNPFLAGCDDYTNKAAFIQKNVYEITDIVSSVMNDIRSSYAAVRDSMRFHHGVTDNVIYRGLPETAKRVIACDCFARPTIKNAVSSRLQRRTEEQRRH